MAFVDKQLKAKGVSEEYLNSICRPVGLPLKDETPAEVGMCVMSEIKGLCAYVSYIHKHTSCR
jgi:xanthine/CO dehydrogenase XdhC/CoxF family maturation factor